MPRPDVTPSDDNLPATVPIAGADGRVAERPWIRLTAGDGSGPHGHAYALVTPPGGGPRQVVCRCGTVAAPAAHTFAYRDRCQSVTGATDAFAQHLASVAGLCVHCFKATCWCHMTVGS